MCFTRKCICLGTINIHYHEYWALGPFFIMSSNLLLFILLPNNQKLLSYLHKHGRSGVARYCRSYTHHFHHMKKIAMKSVAKSVVATCATHLLACCSYATDSTVSIKSLNYVPTYLLFIL